MRSTFSQAREGLIAQWLERRSFTILTIGGGRGFDSHSGHKRFFVYIGILFLFFNFNIINDDDDDNNNNNNNNIIRKPIF